MNASKFSNPGFGGPGTSLGAVVASGQVPTADDFLPPVSGGPTDVKQPAQVAMTEDVVTPATARCNERRCQEERGADGSRRHGRGCAQMVKYPSGLGFVASGAATYRTMADPTRMRLANAKPHVIASTMAKKNLAEILGGLSNEGKGATPRRWSTSTCPRRR